MAELNSINEDCLQTVQELDLQEALKLAVFLQQKNRIGEAEDLFLKILAAAPDHPDALHYYGIIKHFQGDSEKAVELIEKALEIAPAYLQAYNNLGNIHIQNRQYQKAEAAYRKVLELDPDFKTAYNNLGLALKELGNIVEAVDVLLKAIQLDPYLQMFYQNLGNIFRTTDELNNATEMYLNALSARPFNPDTYRHLSASLKMCGQDENAVRVLQKLLEIEPDNALALHTLSAYTGQNTPSRAEDQYVRETFDRFALSFDGVLKNLQYQAPFLVEQAFRAIQDLDKSTCHVLDAGCGTGLCGPLLRPQVGRLSGVDLSEKMLIRAADRHVYDELFAAELTAFLQQSPAAYDTIISADVLCYFGDLSAVLLAVANALKPAGYAIFTVEHLDESQAKGYRLNAHGRYSHRLDYVEQSLRQSGLNLLAIDRVVLRMESGKPVEGLLVTAKQTAGA